MYYKIAVEKMILTLNLTENVYILQQKSITFIFAKALFSHIHKELDK